MTPSSRAARKRTSLDRRLAPYVKAALPTGGISNGRELLAATRTLAKLSLLPRLHKALRSRLVDALDAHFKTMQLQPRDFGMGSTRELADLFLHTLERVGYHEYLASELRAKRTGLHGNFGGELFELLVLNEPVLQSMLAEMAHSAHEALTKSAGKYLIDASGRRLGAIQGKWGPVERVTDIVTYAGNAEPKFTDFAYITRFKPTKGGKELVVFLVEAETKLPAAAKEFRIQMSKKQLRFTNADGVAFMLHGKTKEVTADCIVFNQRAPIGRVAISTTRRITMSWGPRFVKHAGFADVYWRVGLTMNIDELRRTVSLMFRQL